MRRRTLLTLGGTTLSLSVTGCLDALGSEAPGPEPLPDAPDIDCSEASRPVPGPQDGEDLVQPVAYPGQPSESLGDESAIEYAARFEKAYRTNEQITEAANLHRISVAVVDTWTFDSPDGAAVVRLRTYYGGAEAIDENEPPSVHFDNWGVMVTYYIDPALVVRTDAPRNNVDLDELDPDPWDSGEPVACFA